MPEYKEFQTESGSGYLAEIIEKDLAPVQSDKKALYDSFILDVWLANRNGLSKNNTKIDSEGHAVKLSVSGSLGYRASGKPKSQIPDYFTVPEIDSMRDYKINPDAAAALAGMTDDDLIEAIENFEKRYDPKKVKEIVNGYTPENGKFFDIETMLNCRRNAIIKYKEQLQTDKFLKQRGLADEDSSEFRNLHFDKTREYNVEFLQKVSDEDWQKLRDRGLFRKDSGFREFFASDCVDLAKLDDNQHQRSIERGLYLPEKSGFKFEGIVRSDEIADFADMSDEDWNELGKRKILDSSISIVGSKFKFASKALEYDDRQWQNISNSGFLRLKSLEPKHMDAFFAVTEGEEAPEREPSVYSRIKTLSAVNEPESCINFPLFKPDEVLGLALVEDSVWQRFGAITNNFKKFDIPKDNLFAILKLEDSGYENLSKRGLLNVKSKQSWDTSYLKKLGTLTDEEWQNAQKRDLPALMPERPRDWASVAALSDEEFQTALDNNLFIKRSNPSQKDIYFSGDEISRLVKSLTKEDWQRAEERDLIHYQMFNGYGYAPVNADDFASIAAMSDDRFYKFREIENLSYDCRLYPFTKFELASLPDEIYGNIFKRHLIPNYVDRFESYDDCSQDTYVLKTLAELSDKDYKAFLSQDNGCKTVAAKTLIIKIQNMGLDKKQELSELNTQQKREYLRLLVEHAETFQGSDFKDNFEATGIMPQTIEDAIDIMGQLLKSVGIDTKPLDDDEKKDFFSALDRLSAPNSEFRNLNLDNSNFSLAAEYPRADFIQDIQANIKGLDDKEVSKIFDYFGFEITEKPTGTVLTGYPVLINNGEKLAQIQDKNTRAAIERIKPLVKHFSADNKILPNGSVSSETADCLNKILKCLPELWTTVGKPQHKTHRHTLDVHTLAVLQNCMNNPSFDSLSENEKTTLMFASLLHDITKEENTSDKKHPENSALDAFYILQKFGLDDSTRDDIYTLIKNHNMLQHCGNFVYDPNTGEKRKLTPDELRNFLMKYAWELRSKNNAKLELMLTEADLKGVKPDFYKKHKSLLEEVGYHLQTQVQHVKATSIPLPQTKIPSASALKADGVNLFEKVTYDKNGNEIRNKVLYLKPGLDLSQYGFDKGANADNFNVLIHGFNSDFEGVTLDVLALPDKEALLSTSYVVYPKGNYHAFRPQGLIKEVPEQNIGAAYYRDFGSGYKKNVEGLVSNYLNGHMSEYRNYISGLIKEKLNLSDEEFVKLFEKIKDKPLNELESENPDFANAMKEIFDEMEVHKRNYGRDYNEILVTGGKTKGVFFEGARPNGEEYKFEEVPEYLRKYAENNDLPVIYFGK